MKKKILGMKKSNIIIGIIWILIIILCFIYRKQLSVTRILEFASENPWIAAIQIWLLFAIKSVSIVLYSGIFYIVDGIIFPLPIGILVNVVGTIIMLTIPYCIGRKKGQAVIVNITERYPQIRNFQQLRQEHETFFAFLLHFIGMLPCDVLSMYMGAVKMSYPKYLLGCTLGLSPMIILFPIMGDSIQDIRSPQFIISLVLKLLTMCVAFYMYYRIRKNQS